MTTKTPAKEKSAPVPFSPSIVSPPEFNVSAEQFDQLGTAGDVNISVATRRKLIALGKDWIADELHRQSARPKQFRKLVRAISKPLKAALPLLELNPDNAGVLQRHFFNWIVAQQDNSAAATYLLSNAEGLIDPILRVLKALEELKNSLPTDSGRARPHGDARSIQRLADIYESAGGIAKAYHRGYGDGMVNTKFGRFAHAYYAMLPVSGKRTPRGFDSAMIAALRRRKQGRAK